MRGVKLRTKAALYGIGGATVSLALLLSATSLGAFKTSSEGFNPGSQTSLSLLLTDPPVVPQGVTALYITYNGLAIHVSGFPGDSGWVPLNAQGTIETLRLVNLSQTISTSNVPSGRYDLVLFTISSAEVQFQGATYGVTVGNRSLVVPFVGGLDLNSSAPAGAIVDILPTVLNAGTSADPQFVVVAGARARQVPSNDVSPEVRNVGYEVSLSPKPWFKGFVANSTAFGIASASLSPNSLTVKFTNGGPTRVSVKMIIITQGHTGGRYTSPQSLAVSTVFSVGSRGTLSLLSGENGREDRGGAVDQVESVLEGTGYAIGPNSSATFTFSGQLTSFITKQAITSGSVYQLILLNEGVLAVESVTSA